MTTIDTKNLKPAKRYANALIELNRPEVVGQDLKCVLDVIFSNNDYKNFFEHPVISLKDKKETIEEIFKEKIDNEVLNFLFVLLDNSRFNILPLVYEVYSDLSQKAQNIIHAQVASVIELDDNQKNELKEKLSRKLQKQIEIDYEIKKEIIAGLTVKIEDNIIDLSLKAKFDKLKKA